MATALAVTLLATVGKLVGCGLPVVRLGRRSALIIGVGMIPRGEVGLIVASLGLTLGVIDQRLFNVVVIMSIRTTFFVPPFLRLLYSGSEPDVGSAESPDGEQTGHLPDL